MGFISFIPFALFGFISLGGAYFTYEIGTARRHTTSWIEACRIALASIFGLASLVVAAFGTSFVTEDGRLQLLAGASVLIGLAAVTYLKLTKPALPPEHAFTSDQQ